MYFRHRACGTCQRCGCRPCGWHIQRIPVTTVDRPKISLQRLHYGGYEASISRVYFKAFRTQGIRWLSRNGPCADPTQFFSHLHRPPRREPSNISPRQFIDSDWQWRRCGWLVRHALSWHGRNRYRIRLFTFVLLGLCPAFAAGLSGVALSLALTSAIVVCGKFASVNQYVGAQGRPRSRLARAMHLTCNSTSRLFPACRHALSRTATILRVSPRSTPLFVKAITFPIRLAARACIAIFPREV